MGIPVKTVCSECGTNYPTIIKFDDKFLKCPVCGHSLDNLPEEELESLQASISRQRMYSAIALLFAVIGIAAFFYWALSAPNDYAKATEWFEESSVNSSVLPGLGLVGMLVAVIFGILGSWQRFVIEY
jgi:hypothetical protein